MQYTKLGDSALTVSRICMGCMGFGDVENGQHIPCLADDKSEFSGCGYNKTPLH